MGWKVNDAEFESVLALAGRVRYEYFVKRAASHGQLWGLRGDGGWVVAEDNDGNQHFPVWPHQRFAEACATGPWRGEEPVPLDVDEWSRNGYRISKRTVCAWPCSRRRTTKAWRLHRHD
jgi:Protein of unknown function (DUF2750)